MIDGDREGVDFRGARPPAGAKRRRDDQARAQPGCGQGTARSLAAPFDAGPRQRPPAGAAPLPPGAESPARDVASTGARARVPHSAAEDAGVARKLATSPAPTETRRALRGSQRAQGRAPQPRPHAPGRGRRGSRREAREAMGVATGPAGHAFWKYRQVALGKEWVDSTAEASGWAVPWAPSQSSSLGPMMKDQS